MEREGKLGSGTYGIVYSGREHGKKYAVKRNVIDHGTTFLGSLKEVDVLSRLKGHPYIVALKSITFGSPFKPGMLSPIAGDSHKDDGIHFIFEKASFDGEAFIKNRNFQYIHIKLAMVQVLLGLEYIHSKGFIHRDLKPPNLLCFTEGRGKFKIKICDFGLAKPKTRQGNQTPHVVTAWYRAPEVTMGNRNYDERVDIWSLGCIFYEMITKIPLYYGLEDDNMKLLNHMVYYHPTPISRESYGRMSSDTNTQPRSEENIKLINGYLNIVSQLEGNRRTLSRCLALRPDQIAEFENNYGGKIVNTGTYVQFIDLLQKMLAFDPRDRCTASEALNHPFFSEWSEYITDIRRRCPPVPNLTPIVRVYNIEERQWAIGIAFAIFDNRNKYKWYKHRILFQAISIFDRYLRYLVKHNIQAGNQVKTGVVVIRGNVNVHQTECGRYLSKYQVHLYFATCIYIALKYFASLIIICPFENLMAELYTDYLQYVTLSALSEAEQFEKYLTYNVSYFIIYQPTLLEMADIDNHCLTEIEIRDLLVIYGKLETCETVNIWNVYKQYRASHDTNHGNVIQ